MILKLIDKESRELFQEYEVNETDATGYLWYKHNVFGIEEGRLLSTELYRFREQYFGDRRNLTVTI